MRTETKLESTGGFGWLATGSTGIYVNGIMERKHPIGCEHHHCFVMLSGTKLSLPRCGGDGQLQHLDNKVPLIRKGHISSAI